MDEEKKVTGQVGEGEEKTSAGRAGGRKRRGLCVLAMVCCLVCVMTTSASATDGGTSGGDLTAITGAFSTVTSLVSTVFSLITGNPLLAVFVAVGLMGSGIGIFRKLKKASH